MNTIKEKHPSQNFVKISKFGYRWLNPKARHSQFRVSRCCVTLTAQCTLLSCLHCSMLQFAHQCKLKICTVPFTDLPLHHSAHYEELHRKWSAVTNDGKMTSRAEFSLPVTSNNWQNLEQQYAIFHICILNQRGKKFIAGLLLTTNGTNDYGHTCVWKLVNLVILAITVGFSSLGSFHPTCYTVHWHLTELFRYTVYSRSLANSNSLYSFVDANPC